MPYQHATAPAGATRLDGGCSCGEPGIDNNAKFGRADLRSKSPASSPLVSNCSSDTVLVARNQFCSTSASRIGNRLQGLGGVAITIEPAPDDLPVDHSRVVGDAGIKDGHPFADPLGIDLKPLDLSPPGS